MTFRILKKAGPARHSDTLPAPYAHGTRRCVGGSALVKTLKGTLLIGSFLILAWIAYCLTCLTEDWFSYSSEDAGGDVEIVLLKC